MKRLIVLAAVALAGQAFADTYVQGYVRSDGTYVAPHYRTNPDNTILNNYSTKPNVNPYTGKVGTVDPYQAPKAYTAPSQTYRYYQPAPSYNQQYQVPGSYR